MSVWNVCFQFLYQIIVETHLQVQTSVLLCKLFKKKIITLQSHQLCIHITTFNILTKQQMIVNFYWSKNVLQTYNLHLPSTTQKVKLRIKFKEFWMTIFKLNPSRHLYHRWWFYVSVFVCLYCCKQTEIMSLKVLKINNKIYFLSRLSAKPLFETMTNSSTYLITSEL